MTPVMTVSVKILELNALIGGAKNHYTVMATWNKGEEGQPC